MRGEAPSLNHVTALWGGKNRAANKAWILRLEPTTIATHIFLFC